MASKKSGIDARSASNAVAAYFAKKNEKHSFLCEGVAILINRADVPS